MSTQEAAVIALKMYKSIYSDIKIINVVNLIEHSTTGTNNCTGANYFKALI